MKRWNQRPIEIRNLFNPAFCGLVLTRALREFEAEDELGMPYSLSLLILPLSLHKETREIFAANSRSYFLKVVESNPQILIDFSRRAKDLMPYTQEAFALLTHLGCIEPTTDGKVKLGIATVRKTISGTDESKSCQNVARYLGRQFARISDRVTIFATLGVRP